MNEKIPCSVGMLTFNSEKTLTRALESVCAFSDIVIADGGSTDKTLDIARAFGARIIDQHAKQHPGPEPRHPITDFAREHNQLRAAATEDWYLRLDSDEYISTELRDQIRDVVQQNEYDGCRLVMHLQSPDARITYRLPRPIYQVRLVKRMLGSYTRKIHETFTFTTANPKLVTLTGAWYVPISKPDFATYRWVVNYRLRLLNESHPIVGITKYFTRGWYKPMRNTIGIILRLTWLYVTTPRQLIPPLYYFRNRLYSQWVTFRVVNQLYFGSKKHGTE